MSRTIALSGSQARPILIGTALLLLLGMGIRQSKVLKQQPSAIFPWQTNGLGQSGASH
jgi:hypothetical protein